MALIVGAPVYERGWILQNWFDALAEQEDYPVQDIEVVLNYGRSDDDTLDIIKEEAANLRFGRVTVLHDTLSDHVGNRLWNLDRYATMVRLRNDLLTYVRAQKPDYYMSCDTDMLLPPHTLRLLFKSLSAGGWDGIAPLTFMTTHGEAWPNCTALDGQRYLPSVTGPMMAVFGTVLMNERLYSDVDYATHAMGEDFGWAANAAKKGLTMAICTDVRVKHVMNKDMLGTLDDRIGF